MIKNILIKSILLGSLTLSLNANFIRDNPNQVVYDTKTGLMWQDDAVGSQMDWSTAVTTCENLTLGGYSDWRIPTIEELESIVNYGASVPAKYSDFLNFASGYYWSSATSASNSSHGWGVYFNYGDDDTNVKMPSYYVRCVRAGQ